MWIVIEFPTNWKLLSVNLWEVSKQFNILNYFHLLRKKRGNFLYAVGKLFVSSFSSKLMHFWNMTSPKNLPKIWRMFLVIPVNYHYKLLHRICTAKMLHASSKRFWSFQPKTDKYVSALNLLHQRVAEGYKGQDFIPHKNLIQSSILKPRTALIKRKNRLSSSNKQERGWNIRNPWIMKRRE